MGFIDHSASVIAGLNSAAERAMKRVGISAEKQYKENLRSTLNTTGLATGNLLSGATHEVANKGMDSSCRVGNGVINARIHEFGGVIHAKNGPYLSFPTPDGGWAMVESVTIPRRPTLRPAVMDHLAEPARIFAEEMGR